MDYAAMLQTASQATVDTLPQTLQTLFLEMFAASLLDTEAEAILQALRKATRVSIQALRADWKKFLATRNPPGTSTPPGVTGGGTTGLFTDPEPWPTAVDRPGLLADLSALYSRYIVLPDGAAEALALWTLHTYCIDAAQVSPRLAVLSPQKRCGKTSLLALLSATTHKSLASANISASALFRVIEQWRPSLIVDEADRFLRDSEELIGVINAGHFRPTAYVVRAVPVEDGWEAKQFFCFASVAIAAIGTLPGTIADRAIAIKLRRKTKAEQVERLRLDRLGDAEGLRRRCRRWAADHLAQLRECDPAVPETLNDRAADNWRPLCAIAAVAGGAWPQRSAQAINALTPLELDDEAAGVLLLEDFHQLFTGAKDAKRTSAEVVAALHKLEERPWSEWGRQEKPITARQVARLLASFGIKSKTIRLGIDTAKGYEQEDFLDAWARYLPLLSVTPQGDSPSVTTSQVSNDAGSLAVASVTPPDPPFVTTSQVSNRAGSQPSLSVTSSNGTVVTDDDDRNPALQAACDVVTDRATISVTDERGRNPALQAACDVVTDHTPLTVGDWVWLLSAESVQQNAMPYQVQAIAPGSDDRLYAQFAETPAGWLVERCKKTAPPAPSVPDDYDEGWI